MDSIAYDAPVIERGVGVFETVLLVGARASFFREHAGRLCGTLARLQLPAPDEEGLVVAARTVVAARPAPAADEEGALRLTWLAHGKDVGTLANWRLDASTRPIPAATLRRRRGSRAVTLPREMQRDTPEIKSTSYFASVLGLRWAERQGADEGLFVATDGSYLEGTATALLAWDGGRLVRPVRGILPSVTAAAFARFVAAKETRRPLGRSDLLEGAIVLGALTRGAPLLSVDGHACAQPAKMMDAIEEFNRFVQAGATAL